MARPSNPTASAPRDVNFNLLNAMGGGRPGDPWLIPTDIRQSLQQRYREAANRELNLGRHRRAAYIFAELLGDYASAASALEQGRCFREAAVLYRDRLNNRQKAAECLEHGGLLSEAIEIYKEMSLFEKAGDLCTILDRLDDAAGFYRLQVESYRRRSDLLPASRLLERKLNAPDEALQLLTAAWPDSKAAGECLLESFQLLGRLARHEEASLRILLLRQSVLNPDHATTAAKILSELSTHYPEAGVRAISADATRVVAGRQLSRPAFPDRATMARAVARLAPEDRLLGRDAERFARAGRTAQPATPALPPVGDPLVIRQFALPSMLGWRTAVASGDGFYALAVEPAGDSNSTIRVVHGLWNGNAQFRTLIMAPCRADPDCDWTLHPVPGLARVIVMPQQDDMPAELPIATGFPVNLQNGTLAWLPKKGVIALSVDEHAVAWVLRAVSAAELALSAHRVENGSILFSHTVPEEMGFPGERVRMVSRNSRVCITFPWGILRFTRHNRLRAGSDRASRSSSCSHVTQRTLFARRFQRIRRSSPDLRIRWCSAFWRRVGRRAPHLHARSVPHRRRLARRPRLSDRKWKGGSPGSLRRFKRFDRDHPNQHHSRICNVCRQRDGYGVWDSGVIFTEANETKD